MCSTSEHNVLTGAKVVWMELLEFGQLLGNLRIQCREEKANMGNNS